MTGVTFNEMTRFPTLFTHTLPADPRGLANVLTESVANGTVADGYVRVEAGGSEHFLFVHQGRAHSAGMLEEDRFVSRSFPEFFGAVSGAQRVTFQGTDAAMLLCTAVLFRKAPSAQIPARLLNSEELLYAIRETGKDAVLVVRNGDARSLVFCKGGEPAALFAADGEQFGDAGTVADQIVDYLKANPGCHLDLYDEIKIKPTPGAGQPFESYLAAMPRGGATQKEPPSLIVRLGDRVVFRYPVTTEEALIGRGDAADLPLDNVSVSRRHATLRLRGARLVIEDLGSDNGVVFKGQKVKTADLGPGDEVVIGKYTLLYPRYASQADGIKVGAPRANPAMQVEQTMMISSSKIPAAVFEHLGQRFKMGGLIFNIGKADDAHLRIGGFLVAGIHARILRDVTGAHALQHVAGMRSVKVNGKTVKSVELKDGDVITIAGASVKVHLAAAPAAAAPAERVASAKLGPR